MSSAPAEAPAWLPGSEGLRDLIGLDRDALSAELAELGEKPFRARQMLQWIHQRGVHDFDGMTDLSRKLRTRLEQDYAVRLPEVVREQVASDGTRKWLLRLADGNAVEAVYIPEPRRGTLCVSSQVGCAMACTFCATARAGFARNLTPAEIVGQLHVARASIGDEAITNVVFMGMGEPLLNTDAVLAASRIFTDDHAFGLSKRRVTISTSGVVPAIEKLREQTDVSLAVSLHAPNNPLRDELVPLNRKNPLERLLPACHDYIRDKYPRRITWEYVMLDGVNDSEQHAHELADCVQGIPSKINLIPFNPFPGAPYECSPAERIRRFSHILAERDVVATTRVTRGEDIDGACGQLVGQLEPRRTPVAASPAS